MALFQIYANGLITSLSLIMFTKYKDIFMVMN